MRELCKNAIAIGTRIGFTKGFSDHCIAATPAWPAKKSVAIAMVTGRYSQCTMQSAVSSQCPSPASP
jgi:hypothetical protein